MTYGAIGNFIPVGNKAVAGDAAVIEAFTNLSIIDCVPELPSAENISFRRAISGKKIVWRLR